MILVQEYLKSTLRPDRAFKFLQLWNPPIAHCKVRVPIWKDHSCLYNTYGKLISSCQILEHMLMFWVTLGQQLHIRGSLNFRHRKNLIIEMGFTVPGCQCHVKCTVWHEYHQKEKSDHRNGLSLSIGLDI